MKPLLLTALLAALCGCKKKSQEELLNEHIAQADARVQKWLTNQYEPTNGERFIATFEWNNGAGMTNATIALVKSNDIPANDLAYENRPAGADGVLVLIIKKEK